MAIIDERGRMFGRWHLLDAALVILVLGLIPLGYAAYLLFREQPPSLESVTPNRLEQANEFRLTIKGRNLRPYMRVSVGTQQAREFVFKNTEEAEAPFVHVPPGVYDLVLFDQAQERFRLPNAVTITPSGLPATQVVVVGAFGNLDAAGAATLVAGTELPGAGRILSVGKPEPDSTKVFAGSALVGVPVPNALRVPATVQLNCHVRAQQGTPFCVIDDATVVPLAMLRVRTPLGLTPFQIERVRGTFPSESRPVDVLLTGSASLLSLVKAGDVDLNGTANELALLARVERVAPGPSATQLQVRLLAQLQRTEEGWLYNSAVVRVGSPITLRTPRYEVSGIVTSLPPLGGSPQ